MRIYWIAPPGILSNAGRRSEPHGMRSVISIVIVNWNGLGFLPNCLQSLANNPPSVEYDVVIVDNDSTDGSREWLRSNAHEIFPKETLTLIETEENLGFSKANNLAIGSTTSEKVLLLNPDTIVRKGALDRLMSTLDSTPSAGVVAPRLLNSDGSVQYSVWAFPPTPFSIIASDLQLARFIPKILLRNIVYSSFWDYRRRVDVPSVSGAAMMMRRQTIEEVGLLDPEYHMYGEDVEWCARIKRAGWKILFEPDAEITHLGGQSSVQRWGTAAGAKMHEAGIEVQFKCLPRYLILMNTLASTFTHGIYYLKNMISGGETDTLYQVIRIQIRGALRATKLDKLV